MPSLSAGDISRSPFLQAFRCAAQHGSPPDSLALRSRLQWRPEGAGHYLCVFADGLLIVTRRAYHQLPHPPAAPELTGGKAVKSLVAIASIALGPVSQLVELAGHLAEGLTDLAIDHVTERYAEDHPQWQREHQEKVTAWQREFAAHVSTADGVIALPRVDLIRVSIVPFMAYGVNLHFRDDQDRTSSYTFAIQVPGRKAAEAAQLYFVGRIRREIAWLARQYAGQQLATEELRLRLASGMRAVLPEYAALPLCARWLDQSLPGWRSAAEA